MVDPRKEHVEEPGLSLDLRVVQQLSQRGGRVAFNGLRRELAAHPESLSRSLRRLERLGTVGHDGNGYFLVDGPEPSAAPRVPHRSELLATVRLPPSVTEGNFVGVLAGRWFGAFRWVGTQEGRDGASLLWSVPGIPGHLVVRWHRGSLQVLAELPNSREVDPALERAGDELLWHALSRLRSLSGATDPAPSAGAISGAAALRLGPAEASHGGWAS